MFWFAGIWELWYIFNTYIVYDNEKIIFSRYYAKEEKKKKDKTELLISDVIKIGFPRDLEIDVKEEILVGAYGIYVSQEICFLLKDGRIISFNTRPYTKKQCREILSLFSCEIGDSLGRALRL